MGMGAGSPRNTGKLLPVHFVGRGPSVTPVVPLFTGVTERWYGEVHFEDA